MHIHMQICTHIKTYIQTYTYIYITQIHIHGYTYTHKNTCTNIHITHIYAHKHTYTQISIYIFIHTRAGGEGMTGHNMDVPFPSHSCSALQCTRLSLRNTENVPSRAWISHMLGYLAWSQKLLKSP